MIFPSPQHTLQAQGHADGPKAILERKQAEPDFKISDRLYGAGVRPLSQGPLLEATDEVCRGDEEGFKTQRARAYAPLLASTRSNWTHCCKGTAPGRPLEPVPSFSEVDSA